MSFSGRVVTQASARLPSRGRNLTIAAVVVVAVIGVASLLSPVTARSAPFVPSSADQVLERLPQRLGGPSAGRVGALSAEPIRDPELAERSALEEIRLYQATSDPRYLGHAEARLSAFWDTTDPPVPLQVLRAKIRASNHEFEPALRDLSRALERQPNDAQALLERASIQTVLGRYEQARVDCAALAPLVTKLFALGCSAGLRGATGDARAAASDLQAAVSSARGLSASDASWAHSLIGELLVRAGDVTAGESSLRRALQGMPEDAYTLGVLADMLLDSERSAEVVPLLGKLERIDGLLLRLAIAERKLDLPAATEHAAELGIRFEEARVRGSAVHRREEARYELSLRDDPERALELALANFGVQREAWDVRLVLAAALAAKAPEKANGARDFAKRSGIRDPAIAKLLHELEGLRR